MKRIFLAASLSFLASAVTPITKETKQLTVSMSASKDSVAPGESVELTLDIQLKPKMHVYAPGVENYIPISWQMAETASAKSQPAKWPEAEKLHLDAIDETVPAYTGQLRVARRTVLAANLKGSVTLVGTLKYQACDDRMCYIPASVPLEWHFTVARK